MSSRTLLPATAALVAALALPAAAADAASVTYVDGKNVWVSSPDGAIKRQVTSDGTAAVPFHLPSADDAGNVVAIKGGSSSSKLITHVAPDGTRTDNVLPWKTSTWTNFGPSSARVSPSGGQLAYTYLWNHGPYAGGVEPRMAVVPPKAPGSPTSPIVDQPGWERPTWIDGKLVAAKNGALHLEMQPLQFTQFLSTSTHAILGGEVSRDKGRYLVHLQNGQTQVKGLVLYAHTGAFPGGSVPAGCEVPANGTISYAWGLSPDGTQVTWSDAGGVHVGTFDPARVAGGGWCAGTVVTLSATGSEPSFGNATLAAPKPADPPPPPVEQEPAPVPPTAPVLVARPSAGSRGSAAGAAGGSGVSGEAGSAADAPTTGDRGLAVVAPASRSIAQVLRGLKVRATAPGAGSLTVSLVAGGRTLGTGRRTATRSGRVVVTLKPTKAGRRGLRRLRGRSVALRVTFVPKGGGARRVATARVRLG